MDDSGRTIQYREDILIAADAGRACFGLRSSNVNTLFLSLLQQGHMRFEHGLRFSAKIAVFLASQNRSMASCSAPRFSIANVVFLGPVRWKHACFERCLSLKGLLGPQILQRKRGVSRPVIVGAY